MDKIKKLISRLRFLCDVERYEEALHELSSIGFEISDYDTPQNVIEFLLLKSRIYYFNHLYNEVKEVLTRLEDNFGGYLCNNKDYIELKYLLLLSQGNIDRLIVYLKRRLINSKNNTSIEYFIRYLLGKAYFWSGDYLAANKLLQRCHSYYLEKTDHDMLGRTDYMMGYIAYQRRFYEVAETYIKKALTNFEKVGRKYQVAVTNMMLGILSYKIGKYKDALNSLYIAEKKFKDCGNHNGLINIIIAKARVELLRENYQIAVSLLEKSLKASIGLGLPREEALSLEFLGEISCLTGKYDESLDYLKRAEALALRMAPEGDVAVEIFRRLGEVYLGMGRFEEAEEYLSKAYKVAEKLEDRSEFGAVLRLYGVLSARRGDIDLARAFFNESIVTLKVIKDRYELGRTYIEAARTYRELLSGKEVLGELKGELLSDAREYATEALHIFSELGIEKKVEEVRGLVEEIEGVWLVESGERRVVRVEFREEWLHEGFIVARSPEMLEVISLVRRLAPSDVSVLITGETGTGKELVARLIHRLSGRSGKFVAVNCASIPESMFESEIFGHRRGAFTGADREHVGLVEEANGGTLFLDEISELTNRQQASLLRVLQERRVKRVGETIERSVDIRLITASNESVESLFRSGKLRSDFYYRISGNVINLPPLRARVEDVRAIFAYYLLKGNCNGVEVEEGVYEYLEGYHWPGNVRELVNLVNVLLVLAESRGVVRVSDLPLGIRGRDYEVMGKRRYGGLDLGMSSVELKELIIASLMEYGGNKSAVARKLGISRTTLYRKMQELGIE